MSLCVYEVMSGPNIVCSAVSKTVEHIIDTRERHLIPLLPSFEVQTMVVGDIQIGTLLIERKTVKDFEASVLDGRYREQRTRLLSHCQTNGFRPLYIIEGDLDRLGGKLAKQALRKFLTRLTLRYGVPVLQTESTEDTAKLCQELTAQLKEDPRVFMTEEAAKVKYTDTISVYKKSNSDDPAVFASAVLQQCTGISAAGAGAILAVYPTLAAVWGATAQQIGAVVVGKRKLGLVVAQRLYDLLHGTATS
jgi:ERCC4-type nuclease